MPRLFTSSGRDFFEVASLFQKSVRRGDLVLATKAAVDLFPRFSGYAWRRMLIMSAEDCGDMVTREIVALYDAWETINKGKKRKDAPEGQVFVAKALVILCKCRHSRDAAEALWLLAFRMPDDLFDAALAEVEDVMTSTSVTDFEMPEWVYDVHTLRGKIAGKTTKQMIWDEHLAQAAASSVFENFEEMAKADEYVPPQGQLF